MVNVFLVSPWKGIYDESEFTGGDPKQLEKLLTLIIHCLQGLYGLILLYAVVEIIRITRA